MGAVGNYYFDTLLKLLSEWDIYAGLNLTYYSVKLKIEGKNLNGVNLSNTNFGSQIGTRYYFSQNWAANLQFGGGSEVSGGKIGVTC